MSKKTLIVMFFNLALISCPALSMQSDFPPASSFTQQEIEYFSRIPDGPCIDVAISGETAYFCNGGAIDIVDFTSLEQPVKLGSISLGSLVQGIAVDNEFIYAACYHDGLRIIDAKDPQNPTEVAFVDTPGWAEDVFVSNQIAYVADGIMGLRLYDVSNPADPKPLGTFMSDYFRCMISVSVEGNFAFVSAADTVFENETRVHILDVSDPENPTLISEINTFGYTGNLVVQDSVLYYVNGNGLLIFDVTNPREPDGIASCYTEGHQASGVAVGGDLVFVADIQEGLHVVNIADLKSPQVVGALQTNGIARDVVAFNDHALVADDYGGLLIVNAQDPTNPVEAGLLDTGSRTCGVAIAGDLALVGKEFDGLQVVDISDPANPTVLGLCELPSGTNRIEVKGTIAYVSNYREGLRIVDFSNPAEPVELGFWETELTIYDAVVDGDYAYVADYLSGLKVVDISDPADPKTVGHFPDSYRNISVEKKGNLVYVVDSYIGMMIVDVSDPTSPVEVGRWAMLDYLSQVDVDGNYAYVVSTFDGMYVVDISDPTAPFQVGYIGDLGNRVHDVEVKEGWAFLSGGLPGDLHLVDVLNPAQPTLVSTYETGRYALDVAVSANSGNSYGLTVMLAGGSTGLWMFGVDLGCNGVLQPDMPNFPELSQNFPNPFNPSTRIAFELSQSQNVSLTVFDLAGRVVNNLIDGEARNAGQHFVTWNGCDSRGRAVPSGTYFYRLDANGASNTKRMMLVR